MPLISEIVVQELLKEGNTFKNRFALSIKIAGKDLLSEHLNQEEKNEINRILRKRKIPFTLN